MKNIYGFTFEKLENYFEMIGQKKFKATQVYEWLYQKRVSSFYEMTNIKKEILQQMENTFEMKPLTILKKEQGDDVVKYLFQLEDGNKIEAVLMMHDYGKSLCVSSQVGCNMGCAFCESGRLKKVRNLKSYEMVLQVLMIENDLQIRISHIVLMGIGEPFDNYSEIVDFINIIKHPKGFAIGARHITVSTCGLVPKIKEFMHDQNQVNLAISLHAPNNLLRNQLMPINKAYPIEQVIETIQQYIKLTNRRVTFEYIMIKNINDSEKEALELCQLLKGINCYVNLIPYNETSHIQYQKSDKNRILKFYDILKQHKINVTIRREFGSQVTAACGQLRSNYEEGK